MEPVDSTRIGLLDSQARILSVLTYAASQQFLFRVNLDLSLLAVVNYCSNLNIIED